MCCKAWAICCAGRQALSHSWHSLAVSTHLCAPLTLQKHVVNPSIHGHGKPPMRHTGKSPPKEPPGRYGVGRGVAPRLKAAPHPPVA